MGRPCPADRVSNGADLYLLTVYLMGPLCPADCVYQTVYRRRFRLAPLTVPAVERTPSMCLSLQEILVVGNCADQVSWGSQTTGPAG